MEQSQIKQTVKNVEELFKLVMNIYWTYLGKLDAYVKGLPETETEKISNLYAHIEDVKAALEHDISLFEKAVNSDTEDLHRFKDQLKIDDIYKQLKT